MLTDYMLCYQLYIPADFMPANYLPPTALLSLAFYNLYYMGFTHKFDTDGYLVKFKAQLVIRRDLQPLIGQDNFAAMLAAHVYGLRWSLLLWFKDFSSTLSKLRLCPLSYGIV